MVVIRMSREDSPGLTQYAGFYRAEWISLLVALFGFTGSAVIGYKFAIISGYGLIGIVSSITLSMFLLGGFIFLLVSCVVLQPFHSRLKQMGEPPYDD